MLENSLFKQARRSSNVCLRTPHLNKQEDLPMYAGELHIQTSEKTFQCMPENYTFKQARRPTERPVQFANTDMFRWRFFEYIG